MNIFRVFMALLATAGIGLGVDKMIDSDRFPTEDTNYYYNQGLCHGEEEFLEHMLVDLSEEDLVLVNAKIDELLLKYDITLEELLENFEVRYEFMHELMDFYEDQNIEYAEYNDGYGMGHHGMWGRR